MDKNAIKKYAVWARRELIERVTQRAARYGVTANGEADKNVDSVNGKLLSDVEKEQRKALINRVNKKGFAQTMEEVAYTWFNRFAALRFMEVNNYLPTHVRVFTNDVGAFHPQILSEAIRMEMDGLDKNLVIKLKTDNQDEELYRYLLITQCNALNKILPGMFQHIADYTELLLPDNLLREGSTIEQMVTLIPEEDWKDQVQIIGWLYQYYNTEPKNDVFAQLSLNVKVAKENIPAATQLFTPDWIVHYMVENSLGRLWLSGHPDDALQAKWKYYVPDAPQEAAVTAKLEQLQADYAQLSPEDLSLIDCCSGSGHILIYAFDVLMDIYASQNYNPRKAIQSILEHNLYGLDIDERAGQLTYFSLMMKARQYDRRLFASNLQPQVCAIEESNGLTKWSDMRGQVQAEQMTLDDQFFILADTLIDTFYDAKNYGSLLQVEQADYDDFLDYIQQLVAEGSDNIFLNGWLREVAERMPKLVRQAKLLSRKYWVCVTNPPYLGSGNFNTGLSRFAKKKFPDYKSDLFAMFMERCNIFVKKSGFQAMITQQSWMFLSSFYKLRNNLFQKTIINLIHLGARAFDEIAGEVVQTVSFVLSNNYINSYAGTYFRLTNGKSEAEKFKIFFSGKEKYICKQNDITLLPGKRIAYWAYPSLYEVFTFDSIECYVLKICKGGFTGNNDFYLRMWFEISDIELNKKWHKYSKGGSFRKWYGNSDRVIFWENDGIDLKTSPTAGMGASKYYGKSHFVWSGISTGLPSFREDPPEVFFDDVSPAVVFSTNPNYCLLGILNSIVVASILSYIAPSQHFQAGDIKSIPIITIANATDKQEVNNLVRQNIKISKADWDSFETSWDFQTHPMVPSALNLKGLVTTLQPLMEQYEQFKATCEDYFDILQANETELNRIFINIYGLQDELTPDVVPKDVTVHRIFDSKDDVSESMQGSNYVLTKQDVMKSFISYAVGCMFGRYSLDINGLAYAGGNWNAEKYKTFIPDEDNIIPITDDEYFDDDIVGRFVQFVETVYGADTLEENLRFIADALGGRGTPREIIRTYFLKDFFKDHCKTYQKRPIYWLFDSGKKNGFKCLIYIHRYQPDTIAKIRTDYIHEQQGRYRTAIARLEQQLNSASTSGRVKLQKRLAKLQAQANELHDYEEKIHHLADQMISIDLDDGVKHNYAIFQDVLAKIK